jgi:hypothetical protein
MMYIMTVRKKWTSVKTVWFGYWFLFVPLHVSVRRGRVGLTRFDAV